MSSITTGSTTYSFTYDAYKNRKSVKVGSGDIAYYIYNAQNGKLIYTVYANGYVTKNVYDELDRIKEVWYTTVSGTLPTTDSAYDGYTYSRKETYRYDEAGNVAEIIDYIDSTSTVYVYDTDGRPIHAVRYDKKSGTVTAEFAEEVTYNSVGLVSKSGYEYLLNGAKYTETRNYVYDSQQRLSAYYYGATTSSADKYTYTYDGLSRLTNRTLTYGGLTVSQTLGYVNGSNSMDSDNATGRVSSVASKVGSTTTNYSYTYDDRGNITHIYVGGVLKYSYTYDNLNQLTRENNAVANKTYVYTYDDAGNILTKKTYAYTTGTLGSVQSTYNYTYGNSQWGDQLTAYRGTTITYDALGNPKSYYNGASYSLGWTKGRLLSSVLYGSATTTFHYNAEGIRTKKVGSTTVEYVLNGSQIVAEKNGDMVITYIYDPQGAPVGMKISGTTYLYEKNLQGDIVGIYTTGGTKVATYAYDAWGKLISSSYTSGYYTPYYYNPFRYRGYYYDVETGFYYLQSRYYDPTTGRFLNADGYVNANGDLQGFNMYAYCSNNPVMYVDYTGDLAKNVAIYNDGARAYRSVSLSIPIDCTYKIGSYSELRKLTAGNPYVEVHHIIEVRFYENGVFKSGNKNDYCIVLPKEYHRTITTKTRQNYQYGAKNYEGLEEKEVVKGLNDIYRSNPLPTKGGNETSGSRIVIGFREGSYTVSVVSGAFDSDIEDQDSRLK